MAIIASSCGGSLWSWTRTPVESVGDSGERDQHRLTACLAVLPERHFDHPLAVGVLEVLPPLPGAVGEAAARLVEGHAARAVYLGREAVQRGAFELRDKIKATRAG
eukprot:9038916-Pyramimonas_sp.AAC.1